MITNITECFSNTVCGVCVAEFLDMYLLVKCVASYFAFSVCVCHTVEQVHWKVMFVKFVG